MCACLFISLKTSLFAVPLVYYINFLKYFFSENGNYFHSRCWLHPHHVRPQHCLYDQDAAVPGSADEAQGRTRAGHGRSAEWHQGQ